MLNEVGFLSRAITHCTNDQALTLDDKKKIIKDLSEYITAITANNEPKLVASWMIDKKVSAGLLKAHPTMTYLAHWAIRNAVDYVRAQERANTFLDNSHPLWSNDRIEMLESLYQDLEKGISLISIQAYLTQPTDIKVLLPKTLNKWFENTLTN